VALMTEILGTRALMTERRNITAEPLENSPSPATGSRLILLCFLDTDGGPDLHDVRVKKSPRITS
jgi:hypothetical protein